jgi:hypothetical protein
MGCHWSAGKAVLYLVKCIGPRPAGQLLKASFLASYITARRASLDCVHQHHRKQQAMPHPKGNVKLSGDVHLPDAESDLAVEEGRTGLGMLAHERKQRGRPGGGARKAGLLVDPDLGSTERLAHVTRGDPIQPGEAPLAAYAMPARPERHSLRNIAWAFLAGLLLYKLVRH